MVTGCRSVLEELRKLLDKHSEIGSSGGKLEQRAKKVWQRLNWEPKDVCEFRDQISSNVSLLNAIIGKITR